MIRTISRMAVGGSVTLARLPADTAIRLAGGSDRGGPAAAAKVTLDRAEAAVRGVAATLLADPVLREDANRRAVAADERREVLRLRGEAAQRADRADERLAERRDEAAGRREGAEEDAQRRREEARRRRDATKSQASRTAQKRKQVAAKKAAETKRAASERARRERLGALESKSAALERKETAVTADDEARRLRAAAARVKAERKNEG